MHSRFIGFLPIVFACLAPHWAHSQLSDSVRARNAIVPLIEYHQHIVGPRAISPPPVLLPTLKLPPDFERLLRERERIAGTKSMGDVFTKDAEILDVSEAEDHWVRGPEAVANMVNAYEGHVKYVPNSYGIGGVAGYIAGIVRGRDTTNYEMHFMFGLKKEKGAWRIASEYATNKPPLVFAKPITAEKTIQVIDDAGIQRAVVLSVAYWFGSPFSEHSHATEYADVRAENDWVVEQVAHYPERLVAFCAVNPLKDYAITELERCSKLPGVKGMKLHFGNSAVDLKNPEHVEAVRKFFRAANAHHMAIVVHLWTLDRTYGRKEAEIFLKQILPEAPDVTVQIAHMGGGGRYSSDDVTSFFADAISAGDPRMKNVYFDVATDITEQQSTETLALIAKRMRQIGLNRILFGADTPVPNRAPPLLAWATLRRRLPLTNQELSVIANNVAPYMR